jgi:hypothetical protein
MARHSGMSYLIYRLSRFFLIRYLRLFEKNYDIKRGHEFFFIVSAGRSGTTLLRKILTTRYKLHIPPESESLIILLTQYYVRQQLFGTRLVPVKSLEHKIHKILAEQAWNLKDADVSNLISVENKLLHPAAAMTNLYKLHAQRFNPEASVYGDKTPFLVLHLDLLTVVFNDIKFVHLIRDGRKVVQSRIENFNEDVEMATLRWVWAIEEVTKSSMKSPERILEIKYEDLVSDTDQTIRKIEAFLHLESLKRVEPFNLELGDDVFPHHKNVHNRIGEINTTNNKLAVVDNGALKAKFEKLLYEKGYF